MSLSTSSLVRELILEEAGISSNTQMAIRSAVSIFNFSASAKILIDMYLTDRNKVKDHHSYLRDNNIITNNYVFKAPKRKGCQTNTNELT